MTYARRTDKNQTKTVKELRRHGVTVVSLASVGRGMPDLLVTFRNSLFLLEVKDGEKPASARKLTPDQQKFHALWPAHVVLCAEDALRAVGVKK